MKKKQTIHSQIMRGYTITILMIICLVAVSSFCLYMINKDYQTLARERANQVGTQEAVTAHYQWLDKLNVSIQTGGDFTGSLDYNTCALGKWMEGVSAEDLADEEIGKAEKAVHGPHEIIHTLAKEILSLGATDKEAAYVRYANEIEPNTREVISLLSTISGRYKVMAAATSQRLGTFISFALIANVVLAAAAILFSLKYASVVAKKISTPIQAVADWSHRLALGAENIDFSISDLNQYDGSEIGSMIRSFQLMASSIQENVSVIRRVAEGDMTAFVSIRSSQDSLGENLYRMVQTNDIMFNEILQIAQKVASGSDGIASVSQSLAVSTNTQAHAVQDLSHAIDAASDLVIQNDVKTKEAAGISDRLRADAQISSQKMNQLLTSVEEIREASQKVSFVIKTIDDIAFQTNILALNAAVEAARAGEAGKGFAVVANEVRQLALNSANAVTESKRLIESTIGKTQEGSRISQATSETFQKIIQEVDEILNLILEISVASGQQMTGIAEVRSEIRQISESAASNADISTRSSEESLGMRRNADLLKESMSKFNLRKREAGHAYIPPEKQNDQEYIRKANELYNMSIKTGHTQGVIESLDEAPIH